MYLPFNKEKTQWTRNLALDSSSETILLASSSDMKDKGRNHGTGNLLELFLSFLFCFSVSKKERPWGNKTQHESRSNHCLGHSLNIKSSILYHALDCHTWTIHQKYHGFFFMLKIKCVLYSVMSLKINFRSFKCFE